MAWLRARNSTPYLLILEPHYVTVKCGSGFTVMFFGSQRADSNVWIIGRTKTDGPADYQLVHEVCRPGGHTAVRDISHAMFSVFWDRAKRSEAAFPRTTHPLDAPRFHRIAP
jgi:hypothetical protein